MKFYLQMIILSVFSLAAYSQSFEEIGQQYSQGNLDYVIETGKELLLSDKENPELNMIVGRAMAR